VTPSLTVTAALYTITTNDAQLTVNVNSTAEVAYYIEKSQYVHTPLKITSRPSNAETNLKTLSEGLLIQFEQRK